MGVLRLSAGCLQALFGGRSPSRARSRSLVRRRSRASAWTTASSAPKAPPSPFWLDTIAPWTSPSASCCPVCATPRCRCSSSRRCSPWSLAACQRSLRRSSLRRCRRMPTRWRASTSLGARRLAPARWASSSRCALPPVPHVVMQQLPITLLLRDGGHASQSDIVFPGLAILDILHSYIEGCGRLPATLGVSSQIGNVQLFSSLVIINYHTSAMSPMGEGHDGQDVVCKHNPAVTAHPLMLASGGGGGGG